MANPFAAKQSGMASMFESILPADVLEAIKVAKTQLPNVIDAVQAAVKRIEDKLQTIETTTALILAKVNANDPNYVPPNNELAQPISLDSNESKQLENGHSVG